MTTRMIHPEHGATHAYDNGEIERLKGYGWSVEGEAKAVIVIEAPIEEVVPPEPAQQEPEEPKRKPGRPKKA